MSDALARRIETIACVLFVLAFVGMIIFVGAFALHRPKTVVYIVVGLFAYVRIYERV